MSQGTKKAEPTYDDYVERWVALEESTSWQNLLRTSFSRIHYSEKYSDDQWEYRWAERVKWYLGNGQDWLIDHHQTRHVILPKPLLKLIPRDYFDPEEPGVLRILKDAEWRKIGITQSLGWEHYEVHGMYRDIVSKAELVLILSLEKTFFFFTTSAPEPHILLFRREKDFQEKVRRIWETWWDERKLLLWHV